MCAQFLIRASIKDLEATFGIKILASQFAEGLKWEERILPYRPAPVITSKGLEVKNFSLVPHWSDTPKPKFATHNARVETVTEKATWKKPFLTQHCLVPLSSFIEPIYTGDLAGNMVNFEGDRTLVAAGLFDHWVNRATGEVVDSFAIITSEPSEFVRQVGHDRQPIFLNPESCNEWLDSVKKQPVRASDLLKLLAEIAQPPQLKTHIDRPLKKGWEKRV